MSLLERHLRLLRGAGVDEIVLALGFRHDRVEGEIDRLDRQPRPEIVLNERFGLGSVLTVHTVAEAMTRGGDVLLMDADVLYDRRIAAALASGEGPVNGAPWIEIDFPTDVVCAAHEVLPQLLPLSGAHD